jgi:hypothetical protein
MRKQEIKTEARSPEVAPIKGDTGGSLRSMASSCPASPPINVATATCKRSSSGGKRSCTRDLNMICRTTKAIKTAANAASMANQIWFVTMLANTRPASAPLNPPAMTIARTLAETKPSTRDKSYLLRSALCHNLRPTTAIQLVSSIRTLASSGDSVQAPCADAFDQDMAPPMPHVGLPTSRRACPLSA